MINNIINKILNEQDPLYHHSNNSMSINFSSITYYSFYTANDISVLSNPTISKDIDRIIPNVNVIPKIPLILNEYLL